MAKRKRKRTGESGVGSSVNDRWGLKNFEIMGADAGLSRIESTLQDLRPESHRFLNFK